jgi:hypothetical protein
MEIMLTKTKHMTQIKLRIGIVKPTFTGAAYSGYYNYSTGFYAFFQSPYLDHSTSPADADYYNYLPYPPPSSDERNDRKVHRRYFSKDVIAKAGKLGRQTFVPITDHLEMLSPKIPTTPEEIKHLDEINLAGELYNPYRVTKIAPHIKELLPDADVVILTDGNIHDGVANRNRKSDSGNSNSGSVDGDVDGISNGNRSSGGTGSSNNSSNISSGRGFDILILGHSEYVTQQEYDNLKNFVANGGILICLDGNIFYCEVSYNKDAQTVTLVRGHRWVFDGEKAYWYEPEMYFEDSGERWKEETSGWLGSNYAYFGDIYGHRKGFDYYLSNRLIDIFEYIPLEDQYITNSDGVNIIQDWGAKSAFPDVSLIHEDLKIACYEKTYGKGKSIVFGIYSDMVIDSPEFLKFFDAVLLGNAIASLAPVYMTNGLSRIIREALDGKRSTINRLLNELNILQNINLENQKTIEIIDTQLKDAVKDADILQNINLENQKTIEIIDTQLKDAVKDADILQNINLENQKTIEAKDIELQDINLSNQKAIEEKDNQISQLMNSIKIIDTKLKDALNDEVVLHSINLGHQKAIEEKDNQISQLMNSIKIIDTQLKDAVKDVETLQNINLEHRKAIKEKDAELKRAVKDVETLQNINLENHIEVQDINLRNQQAIEEKDNQISQLMYSIKIIDTQLKDAVKDVETLQNINLEHRKTIEEKDAELKRAVKDVETLQSEVQDINLRNQKAIEEKDNQISQLMYSIKIIDTKLKDALNDEVVLHSINLGHQKAIEAKDIELQEASRDVETLQNINIEHRKTIEGKDVALNEALKKLQKLRHEIDAIHNSISWRTLTPIKQRYDRIFHSQHNTRSNLKK